MVEIRFNASSFPDLSNQMNAIWAPLFISPIVGSPERLVVAVAAVSGPDGIVSVAGGLEKLRCLYGESSAVVLAAAHAALSDFESDLKERGEEALLRPNPIMQILSVGEAKRCVASDLKGISTRWLSSISSLHNANQQLFELATTEASNVTEFKRRGDHLSSDVYSVAFAKKSPISQYFNTGLQRQQNKNTSLSKISIDFQGTRTVANFSTIRPDRTPSAEFNRVLKRLWELDVTQVRAGEQNSDAVKYELILSKPNLDERSIKGRRFISALEDLEGQADEKQLIFRQFSSAEEMVEHLERREAAA